MKTHFINSCTLFIYVFIFSCDELAAQTGNWKLSGNNTAGTEKLGTRNNFDLNIVTDNTTRMTVRANGKVGIGTTNPNVKLHVTGGAPTALTSGGYLVTGLLNSQNLAIDEKSLQSRINGVATALQLNPLGGMVQTGGSVRLLRTISGSRFLEFISTVTNQNDARMEYSSAGSYLYVSSSTNDFASFSDLARFDLLSFPNYVFTVYGSALASGGTWTNSDAKLKKDINDFSNAMNIVRQLKPRTYFYKKDEYKTMNFSSRKQYGFVAQELEEVLPELVQTSQQPVRVNTQGEREMEAVKAVNYSALIPILTKAIQEQEQKINAQEKKIEELTRLVNQLLSPSAMANKSSIQDVVNVNH